MLEGMVLWWYSRAHRTTVKHTAYVAMNRSVNGIDCGLAMLESMVLRWYNSAHRFIIKHAAYAVMNRSVNGIDCGLAMLESMVLRWYNNAHRFIIKHAAYAVMNRSLNEIDCDLAMLEELGDAEAGGQDHDFEKQFGSKVKYQGQQPVRLQDFDQEPMNMEINCVHEAEDRRLMLKDDSVAAASSGIAGMSLLADDYPEYEEIDHLWLGRKCATFAQSNPNVDALGGLEYLVPTVFKV
ncbi:hypothetical protein SARC_14792, partial [Sphaeroforma arctica JP610]